MQTEKRPKAPYKNLNMGLVEWVMEGYVSEIKGSSIIRQSPKNGYVNLTDMGKVLSKKYGEFNRTDRTQEISKLIQEDLDQAGNHMQVLFCIY
jgi:hypothetical protein